MPLNKRNQKKKKKPLEPRQVQQLQGRVNQESNGNEGVILHFP